MRVVLGSDTSDYNRSDEFTIDNALLRDYFAAQAIGCFQLHETELEVLLQGGRPMHETVAKFCYGLADAMMKERNKR